MKDTKKAKKDNFWLGVFIGLMIPALVWFFDTKPYKKAYSGLEGPVNLDFYQGPDPQRIVHNVEAKSPKNVIFMIGDGMGAAQVALARTRSVGIDNKLFMETLPVTGLQYTHSANSAVTDSAASATAMACGIKTNNGMIGIGPDGTKYKSVLELAQEKGMRTGLVVTTVMCHATPGPFAAHVKSRKMGQEILEQMIQSRVNVLFGGGKAIAAGIPIGQDISLIEQAGQIGYQAAYDKEDMMTLEGDYVLGLFADGVLAGRDGEPLLNDMTRKSIDLLHTPVTNGYGNGFFLMIEGSQIDPACHLNDDKHCVRETLMFDLAVKEALDFAQKDKHTLLIVTADHECGGMLLKYHKKDNSLKLAWGSNKHTGIPVPIFAFGPGSNRFAGVADNTEIATKLADLLGIGPMPASIKIPTQVSKR